jgi:hypothetical protein
MRKTQWLRSALVGIALVAFSVSAQTPQLPKPGREIPLPGINTNSNTDQQGAFIACPAQSVSVGSYGTSAEGWSNARASAKLVNTDLLVVGGQKTLACIYRVIDNRRTASVSGEFSILRELPGGVSSCTAVQGGFRCS